MPRGSGGFLGVVALSREAEGGARYAQELRPGSRATGPPSAPARDFRSLHGSLTAAHQVSGWGGNLYNHRCVRAEKRSDLFPETTEPFMLTFNDPRPRPLPSRERGVGTGQVLARPPPACPRGQKAGGPSKGQ